MTTKNRETWLAEAIDVLRDGVFTPLERKLPELHISVGLPHGRDQRGGHVVANYVADENPHRRVRQRDHIEVISPDGTRRDVVADEPQGALLRRRTIRRRTSSSRQCAHGAVQCACPWRAADASGSGAALPADAAAPAGADGGAASPPDASSGCSAATAPRTATAASWPG